MIRWSECEWRFSHASGANRTVQQSGRLVVNEQRHSGAFNGYDVKMLECVCWWFSENPSRARASAGKFKDSGRSHAPNTDGDFRDVQSEKKPAKRGSRASFHITHFLARCQERRNEINFSLRDFIILQNLCLILFANSFPRSSRQCSFSFKQLAGRWISGNFASREFCAIAKSPDPELERLIWVGRETQAAGESENLTLSQAAHRPTRS